MTIEGSNSDRSDLPPPYDDSERDAEHRHDFDPNMTKPKNVPYRPSPDQQRQIDLLSTGKSKSSKSRSRLTTMSSANQTEYFDILPSFEMFQSILKRDDRQFQEDLSRSPPRYGDTLNTTSSHGSSFSSSPRQSIDQTLHHSVPEYRIEQELERQREREHVIYNEVDSRPSLSPIASSPGLHNQNIAVTEDTYGASPLDNIDRLNKASNSAIDIQIFVTKTVPQPNAKSDLESRMKEYTSGDHVNGYIIVTNTSSSPVEFGLFTVSLEGTIKSTERNANAFDFNHRYSRILMKKFLKMYDLNASYGYAYIPNSAGIEYEPYTVDKIDGCSIALPDNRILQPKTKYKKFFTFKFPHSLLDNACVHSVLPHLLPPPSLGVDKTCFYNRGESIALNKTLGYGMLNVRGTPLLTKDFGFDDMSISYTIEAKIIDKVNSKEAVSHQDISSAKNDYVISKSAQYFLRFIPDLKEQVEYCKLHHIGNFPDIGLGGKFLEQLKHNTTWTLIQQLNNQVEKEIDQMLNHEELSPLEMKLKNLAIHGDSKIIQNDTYVTTNRPVDIYGKKKKMILSSLIKLGQSTMSIDFPDKIIPYGSPRLLMKYNNGEDDSLQPISSHMEELYHRESEDVIDTLEADLCFESDSNIRPPPIKVSTNIVAWSYNTEYPLPFELGYDFFYKSHEKVSNDSVETTESNLHLIKSQVHNYIAFLKSNSIIVSKESFMYLKAVQKLGIKKDTIRDYFQADVEEPDWKISQLSNGKFRWTKRLRISLIIQNKHNVTLLPTFQSCLVGRLYCLQVSVKYKGTNSEQNEFAHNVVSLDVPVLVG
ncbi:BUL1 [Candida metapsilosis]|uniref:BUL1 n=1 Tax=Candida metapsilosis TaxID=273372 RepID=A0A8H8DAN3_9ASCO|nr:BUL1 [Candida metapsilosis]